jgi:septum formation protein
MHQAPVPLILASSSRYRAGLLERLGLKFSQISPELDESPLESELPNALASRLGREKARVVALQHPHAWVIGSDQVASIDDVRAIGKPGTIENAVASCVSIPR